MKCMPITRSGLPGGKTKKNADVMSGTFCVCNVLGEITTPHLRQRTRETRALGTSSTIRDSCHINPRLLRGGKQSSLAWLDLSLGENQLGADKTFG